MQYTHKTAYSVSSWE